MTNDPDSRSSARKLREPVQVYLDRADQERLQRLRERLGSSKSDVLRRGLEALERALSDPDHHPALRIIGMVGTSREAGEPEYDVAREHDRYLAESEEGSWTTGGRGGRGGR